MSDLSGICIFTETYYPVIGGGESQAQALAKSLVEHGFSSIVLTRRSHAALKQKEKFGEVTVYRVPPVGIEHYKKWGMLLTSLPMLIRLRRKYDLIFVSGFRVLGIPAVLTSRLLGKTCIIKADSLGEMSGEFFADGLAKLHLKPSSIFFRAFLNLRNKLLQQADAFVAISSEVEAELKSQGVRPGKIHSISNSVDIKKFHPIDKEVKNRLRRKLDLPADDNIFIYTGRLVSYKGLPLLLQVWYEICQQHERVMLLLVGSGGLDIHNCEQELREFVKTNNLQESVHFTGDIHNVHEYLQASDIFVFPTEREAFGISLIEAMACGLPVVATSVGGIKDILAHKNNGLVVKTDDFQELYTALENLLTDISLSVGLGKTARQSVEESFSTQIVTRKYIELFQGINDQNFKP